MDKRVLLSFIAPTVAIPAALLIGSALSLRAPADLIAPPIAETDEVEAAPDENAPRRRVYIPFIRSVDFSLPRDLGRVRMDIAVAVDARDATRLERGLKPDLTDAQSTLVEAILALADEMDASQRLSADLADFRRELPEAMRDAMNAHLAALDLPEAVVEVLITEWARAPGDAGSATPMGSL